MISVHVLVAVVFAYLAAKDDDATHMRLWAISWAIGAARYLGATVGQATGTGAHVDRVAYLALVASGLLFMAGTYRFLRRDRLPLAWKVGAGAVALWILVTWGLFATGHGLPFQLETLPTFLFVGAVDAWTGYVILRSREVGEIRHVLAWALIVWGLHRFDYPFLRQVEGAAPIGFGLAALLAIVVAFGMLMLYFERAWRETRESEERYRSIFENAADGMFQAEGDGRLRTVNPALVRMLGYESADELTGRCLRADLLGDESRDLEALAASSPQELDVELCARGGRKVPATLQLHAVESQGSYYEGSLRDLSQTKRLQEQLLQAQKLEALGRLAGGVAHDFNNVLTAILAGSELAQIELERGLDPKGELVEIREAAKRAAELTKQLLAFSRSEPTAGAKPLRLNDAVAGALAILERLIGEDIRLVVSSDEADPWVEADSSHLEQIVLNLAINARDAMPQGGRLEIVTGVSGGRALLEVRDEGEGISPAIEGRLFDPFFTTKPRGKGTGLGLSTVYGIVNSLGGEIQVESALGAGATFRVFLPTCAPGPAKPEPSVAEEPERSATLLLAEDEDHVRKVTERLLRNAGYEVISAPGMRQALELARGHDAPLDALISDLIMPGGTGVELAAALREERPGLPVLFVSGYTAGELERVGAPSDARLLRKPFSREELLSALSEVLAGAHAR
ncbi:MAG TPA: hybrid sensor histidine kinase/response regulator [Planctomycetes bacterium]|nr:hybrid sensor histidine kinase/response regulator [Planctomycetota bacterium]